MLTSLDPHSVYLTEDDFSDLKGRHLRGVQRPRAGGGHEGRLCHGYRPIDGSPAADADLQSGDVILKLDNVPIKGLSLGEAIDKCAPQGAQIELTIGRPGTSQPFTVTLKRDTIRMASVRERWLEPGYGYIRIAQFQLATGEDAAGALDKLQARALKGLVLDLRNKPGRCVERQRRRGRAVPDGGPVVYTEDGCPTRIWTSMPSRGCQRRHATGGADQRRPASASEIVAGALQDRAGLSSWAVTASARGSVQTILPLSDSRAVKLTTALYFTPNGRSIQAEGIVPDIPWSAR